MKVDLEKLNELKEKYDKAQARAHKAQQKYLDELFKHNEGWFCDDCGETHPKHGFYPLQAMGFRADGTSMGHTGMHCNKCRRDPKEYEEMFGEKP
ncbi:MAG: hypothetical protein GTN80_03725 [Nitrososphaeria archaeon]|nr:hypothetical protein [Nitrososphaeria archaeon]NIQ32741.1 hypothetical protein [Nitrososphaeria archaeon]